MSPWETGYKNSKLPWTHLSWVVLIKTSLVLNKPRRLLSHPAFSLFALVTPLKLEGHTNWGTVPSAEDTDRVFSRLWGLRQTPGYCSTHLRVTNIFCWNTLDLFQPRTLHYWRRTELASEPGWQNQVIHGACCPSADKNDDNSVFHLLEDIEFSRTTNSFWGI